MNEVVMTQRFIVAKVTKVAPRSAKLKPVRRLVRVMAFGALPFLHRSVDHFFGSQLLMTFVAKFSYVRNRLEFVLANLFVTSRACPYRNWTMNKFLFSHLHMATSGYA
jgi:hypothetical protein